MLLTSCVLHSSITTTFYMSRAFLFRFSTNHDLTPPANQTNTNQILRVLMNLLLFYPEGDSLIYTFFFFVCFFSTISLDIIRSRLDQGHPDRYRDVQSFINDIRLMFNNVYLFYQVIFLDT